MASRDPFIVEAIEEIESAARAALARQPSFTVVLSGGTTPAPVYRALSGIITDWSRWCLFVGDERCMRAGSPDRNDTMIRETLVRPAGLEPEQLVNIRSELGPEKGAWDYGERLEAVGLFDLVLLGLGNDGHTASLFPGRAWGRSRDAPAALPVVDAPKPPRERVTMSAFRLSQARSVLFLVRGRDKQWAVRQLERDGPVPASAIHATERKIIFHP